MNSKLDQQILVEDYVEIEVETFLVSKKAENIARGTLLLYREKLKAFVDFLETQGVKLVNQITASLIRDFLLVLSERGHNSGGVYGFYRVVKTFLRWYEIEEEPSNWSNPISKVKAPRVEVEPIEGIKRDTFDSLLEACEKNNFLGERNRAILLTLLDTGVRASELCNINLEDVNLVDSSILIRHGKGRKPRYVFFGKTTRKQLRRWLGFIGREDNPLFVNRYRERIVYGTLREVMRRLSIKAGVEEPSLHDFRRAFCLECLRKQMSEITIARLMGHTTTQLIGRYAKQTKIDLGNGYKSVVDD